jgi:rhodanese-related sulfurtransferase
MENMSMLQSLFGKARRASNVKTIDAKTLYNRLQAGEDIVLVDVRTPGEYEYNGRIAESRLLPLSALGQRASELPKDKTVVMVCRSGARSHTACEHLLSLGYENVLNLKGGMIAWKMNRLPVE